MCGKRGFQALKQFAEYATRTKGYDRFTQQVKIIDSGHGKCTAKFVVKPEHLNLHGCVHGGIVTTLLDTVSDYALVSKSCNPGENVDLQLTFLLGPILGEELVVKANTINISNNIAHIESQLLRKNTGEVVAKSLHSKLVNFV